MSDYEIDEVRYIRHKISAQYEDDIQKLVAYYQQLEQELRKSGKYKFLDEKPVDSTQVLVEQTTIGP